MQVATQTPCFKSLVKSVSDASALISGIHALDQKRFVQTRQAVLTSDWTSEAFTHGEAYLANTALYALGEISAARLLDAEQAIGCNEMAGLMIWPQDTVACGKKVLTLHTPQQDILKGMTWELLDFSKDQGFIEESQFETAAKRDFNDLTMAVQRRRAQGIPALVFKIHLSDTNKRATSLILPYLDNDALPPIGHKKKLHPALNALFHMATLKPPGAYFAKKLQCFYLPSYSLISEVIEPKMRMEPLFGLTSANRMKAIRKTNAQPFLIFNPWVPNNMVAPHGFYVGRFFMQYHDRYHHNRAACLPQVHRTAYLKVDSACRRYHKLAESALRQIKPFAELLPADFVVPLLAALEDDPIYTSAEYRLKASLRIPLQRDRNRILSASHIADKKRSFLDQDFCYVLHQGPKEPHEIWLQRCFSDRLARMSLLKPDHIEPLEHLLLTSYVFHQTIQHVLTLDLKPWSFLRELVDNLRPPRDEKCFHITLYQKVAQKILDQAMERFQASSATPVALVCAEGYAAGQ